MAKQTGTETNNDLHGGTGKDTLIGLGGADRLYGNGENDALYGGAGDDSLDGGGGNDRLIGGGGHDMIYGGAGNDTIESFGSRDTVYGGEGADSIYNIARDLVYGGSDNDTLVGHSSNHADTLYGDGGNDSLVGGGNDALYGGAGGDNLTGGTGDDTLDGGTGADHMIGGQGDDVYIVDNNTDNTLDISLGLPTSLIGDQVVENDGEGTDEVRSSVDYTLGANVENLTLTGSADLSGTGNDLDNEITGNDGNNTLSGESGDDIMSGGIGNDTFIENGNDGADTISDFSTNDDFVDLSSFYNDTVVSAINEAGGTQFGHGLGLLRADQADAHLDGNIGGEDYTSFIDGINLSLQSEGGAVDGDDLSVENTNVACFSQGTLIRAQNGEVPIENLKPGDLVWTQDNGLQPVSWIGSQKLTGEELRKNPNVRPIHIKKGALGLELPIRDLVVSPQHRILISSKIANRMTQNSEVLIAAKFLTQIPGISTLTDIEPVEYFHLMFETHQLIAAEGALAESFYLGSEAVKGLQPAARLELEFLFPLLFEKSFMPKPVRPFISGKRGRKIASRHMKNTQPLFSRRRA